MSQDETSCIRCGARLEPDQEYCLQCGARQAAPRPRWRRALIAAAVTVALAALVLVFGYERMRDDANTDAAARHAAGSGKVRQAGASDPATGTGAEQPVPGAHLAARKSP
jgi:hypothetical protein